MTRNTCGLDEAGRGALSGPLVIAAVVIPQEFRYPPLESGSPFRDSKFLTARQRLEAYRIIMRESLAVETVAISARAINRNGINWANIEGFRQLIASTAADNYIVDGRWRLGDLGEKSGMTSCMVRADQTVPSVMAAGIVAKVVRDRLLQALHRRDPRYGWDHTTGHGTYEHIEAIRRHGVTREHRTQFVTTALSQSRRSDR